MCQRHYEAALAILNRRRDARKQHITIPEFRTLATSPGFFRCEEHRVHRKIFHSDKRNIVGLVDTLSWINGHYLREGKNLPSVGHAFYGLHLFVPWEAKAHEPFAEDFLGQFF